MPTRIAENFESKGSLVLAHMAELSVSMYLGPGKQEVAVMSAESTEHLLGGF